MTESFILYTEYADHLEFLTMEQRGVLITAVFAYVQGKELPEMEPAVAIALSFITKNLDRNREKYETIIEKRSQAGIASAKARAIKRQQTATKLTLVEMRQQTSTNSTDNVNDNDNENENVNDNENVKEKRKRKAAEPQGEDPIEEMGFSPEMESTVRSWVRYKTEKRQAYKETGLRSLLTRIRKEADARGDRAVINLIQESMANNWQGIIWDRLQSGDRIANRVKEVANWKLS